jgi:hypothetical protein
MRETIRTGVLAAVSVAFLALALLMLSGCGGNAENGARSRDSMIGNPADKH